MAWNPRDLLRFERRALDADGQPLGPWAMAFSCSAEITWLRGGEGVLVQRLQGQQPVVITVRAFEASRSVTNAWRAVDDRDETRVFAITAAAPNRDDPAAFIDILAVQQVGQTDG